MHTMNIHAAKTKLSRLVEQIAAGQEITMVKAGNPFCGLPSLLLSNRLPRQAPQGQTEAKFVLESV